MARLIYPENFTDQQTLLSNIIKQHSLDGADSPLNALLAEQGIDLVADAAAGNTAAEADALRSQLSKDGEKYTEQRNMDFAAPWEHLRGCVQVLKTFYQTEYRRLGDWGITVDGQSRIVYPAPFLERVGLFNTFFTKNASYPAGTSPLDAYLKRKNIVLAEDQRQVQAAVEAHTSAKRAEEQSEKYTEERDRVWNPVLGHIEVMGSYLMNFFDDEPKAVGDYGFTVVVSAQEPSLRTSKVLPAATVVRKSIVIGSAFTNVGETDLEVYRGPKAEGTPQVVKPGEQLGMIKGYSTITVHNPSTLVEGKFSIMKYD